MKSDRNLLRKARVQTPGRIAVPVSSFRFIVTVQVVPAMSPTEQAGSVVMQNTRYLAS